MDIPKKVDIGELERGTVLLVGNGQNGSLKQFMLNELEFEKEKARVEKCLFSDSSDEESDTDVREIEGSGGIVLTRDQIMTCIISAFLMYKLWCIAPDEHAFSESQNTCYFESSVSVFFSFAFIYLVT